MFSKHQAQHPQSLFIFYWANPLLVETCYAIGCSFSIHSTTAGSSGNSQPTKNKMIHHSQPSVIMTGDNGHDNWVSNQKFTITNIALGEQVSSELPNSFDAKILPSTTQQTISNRHQNYRYRLLIWCTTPPPSQGLLFPSEVPQQSIAIAVLFAFIPLPSFLLSNNRPIFRFSLHEIYTQY